MANEAVIIETPFDSRRYQCADGAGLSKGQLLQLVDANTASGSTVTGQRFAGICAFEKVASDGSTNVTAYTKGIFDLKSNDAVNAGELVALSGANTVRLATATDIISGCVVGKALETATANEVIRVAVGVLI